MWAVILLVSSYVATIQAVGICPVIILDNGLLDNLTLTQNKPLRVTEKQEFVSMLSKADQLSSTLLFFIDEALSLEDFHDYDDTGAKAFPLIRRNIKAKKNKILLNVLNPYEIIEQKFVRKLEKTIYLEQNGVLNIEKDMPQKYFYVYFNKIENTPQMLVLRHHEKTILDILEQNDIRQGPIIAIYTGKRNPMELKESIQHKYKPIVRAGSSASGKLTKDGTVPVPKSGRSEFVYEMNCEKLVISFKDPVFVRENTDLYVRVKPGSGLRLLNCDHIEKNDFIPAITMSFEGENVCRINSALSASESCGESEWGFQTTEMDITDSNTEFWGDEYELYDWKPIQFEDQVLKDFPLPSSVAKECDNYTHLRLYDLKLKCHANRHAKWNFFRPQRDVFDITEYVYPSQSLLISPAIIMGLLVSFLLLGVLGFAINMMLSIQTPSILLQNPAAASTEYARRVIVNNQRTQKGMYNIPLTKRSLERQQLINEQRKFAEVSDDSDEQ